MNYIIDTNIISALMRDEPRVKARLQEKLLLGRSVFISAISYYEIKRGLLAVSGNRRLGIFEEMCSRFGVLLLDDREIFDTAAQIYDELRRRGELIEDADILIAALALLREAVVVSGDTDFHRIRSLNVENWLQT